MRTVTFQIMAELRSARVCPEIARNQSGNGRSVCTPLFQNHSERVLTSSLGENAKAAHFSCFSGGLGRSGKATVGSVVQTDGWWE